MNDKKLVFYGMLFGTALITANVVTAKTVQTGIPFFGSTITVAGAILCYALTFLFTDVIGETVGKDGAKTVVKYGFVAQLVSSLLILITRYLPAVDPAMQTAYVELLGLNWVFFIGSMAGYLVSQTWDVYVFHRIRQRFAGTSENWRSHRWVWNNASTMTSQLFDTIIFITIAFGFGFGWLFDPSMLPAFFGLMVGQYLIKVVIAALDTPVFYALTRRGYDSGH